MDGSVVSAHAHDGQPLAPHDLWAAWSFEPAVVATLALTLLFWWSLLRGREGRLGTPLAVVYLFTTAVHTSLLGALLTFSSRLWYPLYASSTRAWGLTPLEDQQLAGVIMWVPAGLAYVVATLAIAGSWLREPSPRPARIW